MMQQRFYRLGMQCKQALCILFVFFLFSNSLNAQNKKIDSLITLLKKDLPDTNKVIHSYRLCWEFTNIGLYDTALYYGNSALNFAQQLLKRSGNPSELKGIKKHLANSYGNLGVVYYYKGDYPKTLEYWLKALNIDEELKNKKGIAKRLGNIANVYSNQGDYPRALDSYFKALKIAEELDDKHGIEVDFGNIGVAYMHQGDYTKALDYYFKALKIAESLGDKNGIEIKLGNIGIIYNEQGDYPKALDYYFKALKIAEELEDKNSIATKLGNIGNVYWKQGDYSKALANYFKALKIAEELGEKNGISRHLGNIGSVYKEQTDYAQALEYYFKALKIAEEIGDKNGVSVNLINIGSLYISLNKYQDAYKNIYRALSLSDSIGLKDNIKDCYNNLSLLYEKTNVPLPDSMGGQLLNMEQTRLRSMYYYKRSIAIRDTLFNQENRKQLVQKEMNYEFDKKEAFTKAANEKQKVIAEEKNRKQKIITWTVVCGLVFLLVFAGFIFRSLHITRKQKQIIEKKNTETELQKKIIEEKNKDITDSIRYAKRIQDALMGEKAHISMHLPEHFILFMPKDIVSGDFHWGAEKHGYWYFAAVDCTGHGVPGAVMSMLGISFLNDIVSSEQLYCPAEILNRLRDKVVKELRQTGEAGGNKDGMDISLCRLNLKTNELQWAGAYNPLNLFRNGELEEIKADKQPIGYHLQSHPFTNHKLQLKKGDSIYIYSDGYADQFGGPKGKKFKYKQLEDLIIANNQLTMNDQKELLKKHFTEWKGALEQIDDVCVFGVRV